MTDLAQVLAAHLTALCASLRSTLEPPRDERGSVSIQEALWAVAAVGFVAIVVAAINAYLNNQISFLRP